jgi:signal transduction histidine kinase
MLYQAFLNIFINALQAMPDGGNITIQLQPKEKMMQISFTDQGEGIPEELLEKIWDPYFTTKDKGTGLGLGIVKNIIDAHNGTIQIEIIPEGGTRVIIQLPLERKG